MRLGLNTSGLISRNMITKTDGKLRNFTELLDRRGLKLTYTRRCVYDKVSRLTRHFDAEELYQALRKEKVRVARATVFRTMPLLLESGVLQKSVGDGRGDYYETKGAKGHHDHMFCLGCHKFIEFHSEAIERIQQKTCDRLGFRMVFHDHKIYGYCENCKPN